MNNMELSLLSKPFHGMNNLALTDATNSLFTAKLAGSDRYIVYSKYYRNFTSYLAPKRRNGRRTEEKTRMYFTLPRSLGRLVRAGVMQKWRGSSIHKDEFKA